MSNGTKRRPRSGTGQISEAAWAFLNDQLTDEIFSGWERWGLEADQVEFIHGPSVRELWTLYGAIVVKRWQTDRPGTRPALWWRFDAPRMTRGVWPDCFWDGTLPLPRLRAGGVGRPLSETTAYVPRTYLGVPIDWADAGDTSLPGIDTIAIDLQDPPRFESQASYLVRLDLLTRQERSRLRRSAFQPESALDILAGMRPLAHDGARMAGEGRMSEPSPRSIPVLHSRGEFFPYSSF
jgi:hypothetical protein